jgi:hypothetical protein
LTDLRKQAFKPTPLLVDIEYDDVSHNYDDMDDGMYD